MHLYGRKKIKEYDFNSEHSLTELFTFLRKEAFRDVRYINDNTVVRVMFSEHRGQNYTDVKLWVIPEDEYIYGDKGDFGPRNYDESTRLDIDSRGYLTDSSASTLEKIIKNYL